MVISIYPGPPFLPGFVKKGLFSGGFLGTGLFFGLNAEILPLKQPK